jgi:hypothetical protein
MAPGDLDQIILPATSSGAGTWARICDRDADSSPLHNRNETRERHRRILTTRLFMLVDMKASEGLAALELVGLLTGSFQMNHF